MTYRSAAVDVREAGLRGEINARRVEITAEIRVIVGAGHLIAAGWLAVGEGRSRDAGAPLAAYAATAEAPEQVVVLTEAQRATASTVFSSPNCVHSASPESTMPKPSTRKRGTVKANSTATAPALCRRTLRIS